MVFWGPAFYFRLFPCHPPYTREVGVPIRRLKILAKFALLFVVVLCQLGPRGASSDAGAQRTTRDKYDASVSCSAAKGPGRLRDDRLFSSDDITILVHGKWGFATTVTRHRTSNASNHEW